MRTTAKTKTSSLKKARSARRPRVKKVADVFENGRLRGDLQLTDMEDKLEERQRRAAKVAVMNGDVPLGVRVALKQGFTWNQIVKEKPWAVMWLKGGKRYVKHCGTLGAAVVTWRKVHAVVPNATIVSRARGYDIPSQLRGKLPKGWRWCPYCMKPRKYRRVGDETFYATIKVWDPEKGRYIPKEHKLALMRCPMCRCTNRDPVFRRSNQPWERRKFKRGVRRAKKGVAGKPLRRRRR